MTGSLSVTIGLSVILGVFFSLTTNSTLELGNYLINLYFPVERVYSKSSEPALIKSGFVLYTSFPKVEHRTAYKNRKNI